MTEPTITLGHYHHRYFPFIHHPLRIDRSRILQHMHVIGLSGSGKSRYLAHLYLSLFEAGYGVSLLDPHGDLGKLILHTLIARGHYRDPTMYERLMFLDVPAAARQSRYLPFNMLRQPYTDHETAINLVNACMRAWSSLAGGVAPTFENLLRYSAYTLIVNHLPLTALPDFLMRTSYRQELLDRVDDPNVRSYFYWFDHLKPSDQADRIESTMNRVNLLTFDLVLRHAMDQPENILDFRRLMDEGRSVIYNLEGLREGTQRLIGCLLTTGYENAAKTRADVEDEKRVPHIVIVDEFPVFTEQSETNFSKMLSETRKYGVYLVLAHQTWGQLSDTLRNAVQNAGIEVIFRGGRNDAENSAPVIGRVDPHRVGTSKEGKQESVGIQEQWEGLVQSVQDMFPRSAKIHMEQKQHRFPFNKLWKKPFSKTWHVKIPSVPTPALDPYLAQGIADEYIERYFREVRGDSSPEVSNSFAPERRRGAVRVG